MQVPTKVLDVIIGRSHGKCERCGTTVVGDANRSTHHRRHLGMGGSKRASSWSPAALLRLCGDGTTGCHGWVEHNPQLAEAQGLVIGQRLEPHTIPAKLMCPLTLQRRWVLLTADGECREYLAPDALEIARQVLLQSQHGAFGDVVLNEQQVTDLLDVLALNRLLLETS